jgi:hypothetical protein
MLGIKLKDSKGATDGGVPFVGRSEGWMLVMLFDVWWEWGLGCLVIGI